MKRFLLTTAIAAMCMLTAQAQKYLSWYSSATDREYGVLADNINGDKFDCMLYGQSLYKYIPIAGIRIAKKDIPAFVRELRAVAEKAGKWWDEKACGMGADDAGVAFDSNFKKVTAWYDMGTPPEPIYHNMKDAKVEVYGEMQWVGMGTVYLSVAPIIDKDNNRHPGVVLPFGSKQEMIALADAMEKLDPNVEVPEEPVATTIEQKDPRDIHITCPQCGAEFTGKSASLAFKNGRNHNKGCPLFNKIPEVPQVPQPPKIR